MTTIPRRFNHRKKDWPVYEREEADRSTDPAVRAYVEDWRDAVAGQYVLTDDGLVVQIVRRQAVRGDQAKFVAYKVVTPVGSTWLKLNRRTGAVAAQTELLGRPTLARFRQTGNVTDWAVEESHKSRAKRAVIVLAKQWVYHSGRLPDEAWDLVGKAYRPDNEIPRATAKRFFMKTPEGRSMLADKLLELFGAVGIDRETAVKNLIETRKSALSNKDHKTAKEIDFRILDLLQVKEEEAASAHHALAAYDETAYDLDEGDLSRFLEEAEVLDEDE